MHNRKTKSVIAAAILGAMFLCGCSGEKHIISYESGETTKAAEKSPAISSDEINAILFLPDDPSEGACMSTAHAEAFEEAAQELSVQYSVVPNADPEDAEELSADSNVIFGAGYNFMNPLDEAAKNNTDKLYACFGGYKYNSTNYNNYYTAIYEAQYLAGITAATNTESGKIGIISEYSSEYPDSAAEINSFAIGARAARADVEILVYSLGSRTNADNAENYTKDLISKGCDVISIQCDTSIPAKIASEKEVFFIGYGTDMSNSYENCLTSVVWNLKDYYKSALTAAVEGTWNSGNYYSTLASGGVSLSELSKDSNTATSDRIESASELIKNDLLEIFSNRKVVFDSAGKATVANGALIDNKDNVMISEDGNSYFIYSGEELKSIETTSASSDKLASASMNYIVQGVIVLN